MIFSISLRRFCSLGVQYDNAAIKMDGKATATELVTYLINASTDTESAANGSGNRLRVSVGFLLMNLVAFMI